MKSSHWYKRLNVQLIALLSLALLPLGLVAVFQTSRVAAEAERTAGLALLALTDRAARAEQVLIERGAGAARLFGTIAPDLVKSPERCRPLLSRFVTNNPDFSLVAIVGSSGTTVCASSEDVPDFSSAPAFTEAFAELEAKIVAGPSDANGEAASFFVLEPYEAEDGSDGFISVTIPHRQLPETTDFLNADGLVELVSFNIDGKVLTTRSGIETARPELPQDLTLTELYHAPSQYFRARNNRGEERRYSIVTIERSPAVVMAVWDLEKGPMTQQAKQISPAIFPTLMWLASMVVAMLAMHTLVLRHLRRLGRKMDHFASTRRLVEDGGAITLTPLEIENLEENFERISDDILRDEASLVDAVHEKDVLVKEVHHRVKNNLQLISSIMSMQIRSAEHQETRDVLRRVQDRVLSLATIHRDLYESQDAGRVDVANLVREIVEKQVEVARNEGEDVRINADIDPILLYPDQAVPLSLLVAESATNAMKFIGDATGQAPELGVRLKRNDDECLFELSNTIGTGSISESTGLGAKLMNAFALQLNGKIEVERTQNHYIMSLRFKALEFVPEAKDY